MKLPIVLNASIDSIRQSNRVYISPGTWELEVEDETNELVLQTSDPEMCYPLINGTQIQGPNKVRLVSKNGSKSKELVSVYIKKVRDIEDMEINLEI